LLEHEGDEGPDERESEGFEHGRTCGLRGGR